MEGVLGNRGKCAQPCRLPYELIEDNSISKSVIDKGYLLSTRDLCSLELLPELIKSGINSFKIEGRMKTPEYVATVTRIYRKYIDLAFNNEEYKVLEQDKKDILQVFNRGGFSSGHLEQSPNRDLVFSKKPNNMGLYVGNISNYNPNKGHITLELNEPLSIGDTISIEGESGNYTISELIMKNQNIKTAGLKSVVKLGRMKGNIKVGSKVYKTSSKSLNDLAKLTYSETTNLKKIPINCSVIIKRNLPVSVRLSVSNMPPFYIDTFAQYISEVVPESSKNNPITKDRIITQFSKLGNTPYEITNIDVSLDDNLYINVGTLNDIRRNAISLFMNTVLSSHIIDRKIKNFPFMDNSLTDVKNYHDRKISVLLECIHEEYDYSELKGFDNIYIPLKYFVNKKYFNILAQLCTKFDMYVYMPTIIKTNYKNLLLNNLDEIIHKFDIKGFVISNIAGIQFLKDYIQSDKFNFVANYTMNIFNNYTINELKNVGINTITPSVEANTDTLQNLLNNSSLPAEILAYGSIVLMNSSYCLLGKINNCYPECKMRCSSSNKYYLKDRLGYNFRILPDNIQTVTSIYNSKITSIYTSNFNVSSLRINILDENINEINNIVNVVKSGKRLEGDSYTSGNLNRFV